MGKPSVGFLKGVIGTRIRGNPTLKTPAPKIPTLTYRGQDTKPPSLTTTALDTAKKHPMHYTGTAVLGIATMHKSNPVPVFSREEAVSLAAMRR